MLSTSEDIFITSESSIEMYSEADSFIVPYSFFPNEFWY